MESWTRGRDAADATAALARSAIAGDRAAFACLVESHHARIFSYLARKTGSTTLAEDLTQDVFVKAMRAIGRLREPERFSGWLYGIAINRLRDHARRMKLRRLLFLSTGTSDGPEADVPDTSDDHAGIKRREFWEQVGRFCAKLSAREREIFGLRFLDGLLVSEVAEALGLSQSAIKTHLGRAVAKLKDDAAFMAFLEGERE